MQQRNHTQQESGGKSGDSVDGERLNEVRDKAGSLFAAADRAFDRVRARDSQGFLSNVRQTGGQ